MAHDKQHSIVGTDHLVTGLTPLYYIRINEAGDALESVPSPGLDLSTLVESELLRLNATGDAVESTGIKIDAEGAVNGQSLIYDDVTSTWKPGSGSIDYSSLSPLELIRLNAGGTAFESTGVKINATGATNNQVLSYDIATLTWIPKTISGGSGQPAGKIYEIQFNNGGSPETFGASSDLLFDGTDLMVGVDLTVVGRSLFIDDVLYDNKTYWYNIINDEVAAVQTSARDDGELFVDMKKGDFYLDLPLSSIPLAGYYYYGGGSTLQSYWISIGEAPKVQVTSDVTKIHNTLVLSDSTYGITGALRYHAGALELYSDMSWTKVGGAIPSGSYGAIQFNMSYGGNIALGGTDLFKIDIDGSALTFGDRDLNYGAGNYSFTSGRLNCAGSISFATGLRAHANGNIAFASGLCTSASGDESFAGGYGWDTNMTVQANSICSFNFSRIDQYYGGYAAPGYIRVYGNNSENSVILGGINHTIATYENAQYVNNAIIGGYNNVILFSGNTAIIGGHDIIAQNVNAVYVPTLILADKISNPAEDGALRWDGSNYKGYKNGNWFNLDTQGIVGITHAAFTLPFALDLLNSNNAIIKGVSGPLVCNQLNGNQTYININTNVPNYGIINITLQITDGPLDMGFLIPGRTVIASDARWEVGNADRFRLTTGIYHVSIVYDEVYVYITCSQPMA